MMTQAEMMEYVTRMEHSLLPCLPARELQAIDRSTQPTHTADVEKHVKDFMDFAKKLQLSFIQLQHQHQPSQEELLNKELGALEAELKEKDELIEKQQKMLEAWHHLLSKQKAAHIKELQEV